MANVFAQNTCHIDTTDSDSGIGTGKGRIRLYGVIFTPNAVNDELELRDADNGQIKYYQRAATAKESKYIDLSRKPIVFDGALHIETITASARAILIVEVTQ